MTRTRALHSTGLDAATTFQQTVNAARHTSSRLRMKWLVLASEIETVGPAAPTRQRRRRAASAALSRKVYRNPALPKEATRPREAAARRAAALASNDGGSCATALGASGEPPALPPPGVRHGVLRVTAACTEADWGSHVRCLASVAAIASLAVPEASNALDGDDGAASRRPPPRRRVPPPSEAGWQPAGILPPRLARLSAPHSSARRRDAQMATDGAGAEEGLEAAALEPGRADGASLPSTLGDEQQRAEAESDGDGAGSGGGRSLRSDEDGDGAAEPGTSFPGNEFV